MDKKKLDYYKGLLLKHRAQIMAVGLVNRSDDLHVAEEDRSDEADLASSLIHQQISCTMRDRELVKLRLIDIALDRIESGHYGHCDECDEEISAKRLENQPWTDLCLEHAEEREREQGQIWKQA